MKRPLTAGRLIAVCVGIICGFLLIAGFKGILRHIANLSQ
jgi:hypothetical protein